MSSSEEDWPHSVESTEESLEPAVFKQNVSSDESSSSDADDNSAVAETATPVASKRTKSNEAVSNAESDSDDKAESSEDDSDESITPVHTKIEYKSEASASEEGSESSDGEPDNRSRTNQAVRDKSSPGSDSDIEKSRVSASDSSSDSEGIVTEVKEEVLDSEEEEEILEEEEYGRNLPLSGALISPSSGVISLENLSENNDLWMVHIPKTISEEDITGAKINFSADSRVRFGAHKFLITPCPEDGTIACVLPSSQNEKHYVVGLPVKGSLMFEESIKLPDARDVENRSEDGVQFPSNLKERHPLLGADYKGRLKQVSALKKLLRKSERRKSGSREKTSYSIDMCETSLNASVEKVHKSRRKSGQSTNDLQQQSSSKERRKSKDFEKSFREENNITDASISPKKKRKRERESEGDHINNNGLEDSHSTEVAKKIKIDQNASFNFHLPLSEDLHKKKKKSKQSHKETESLDGYLLDVQEIKQEVESAVESDHHEESPKKKKKKERKIKKEKDWD